MLPLLLLKVIGALTQGVSQIAKPAADTSIYRSYTLRNGLKVLLVHNPELFHSKFCLAVNAGSDDDYPRFPGISRIFEQMVRLMPSSVGRSKDGVADIIASFGEDSKYSSRVTPLHTIYEVEVSPEYTAKAMSTLAESIGQPAMSLPQVQLAVDILDTEFKMQCQTNRCTHAAILSSLENARSLRIGTGVKKGKAVPNPILIKVVREFWERYYSAKNMCLVFSSKFPLDNMETLANNFLWIGNKPPGESATHAKIPSTNIREALSQPYTHRYTLPVGEASNTIYEARCDWYFNMLSVTVLLPRIKARERSVPLNLIIDTIKNSLETSLVPHLTKLRLLSRCQVEHATTKMHTAITFNMFLTDMGLENYKEVLDYLTLCLNTLVVTSVDIKHWVEGKIQQFNAMDSEQITASLSLPCINLFDCDPADVLRRYHAYDVDTIAMKLCNTALEQIANHKNWCIIMTGPMCNNMPDQMCETESGIKYEKVEGYVPRKSVMAYLDSLAYTRIPKKPEAKDKHSIDVSWLTKNSSPRKDYLLPCKTYRLDLKVKDSNLLITNLLLEMAKHNALEAIFKEPKMNEKTAQINIRRYTLDGMRAFYIVFTVFSDEYNLKNLIKQYIKYLNNPSLKYLDLVRFDLLTQYAPTSIVDKINVRDAYISSLIMKPALQAEYLMNIDKRSIRKLSLLPRIDPSAIDLSSKTSTAAYTCQPMKMPEEGLRCNLPTVKDADEFMLTCLPFTNEIRHVYQEYHIEDADMYLHCKDNTKNEKYYRAVRGPAYYMYNMFMANLIKVLCEREFHNSVGKYKLRTPASGMLMIDRPSNPQTCGLGFSVQSTMSFGDQEAAIRDFVPKIAKFITHMEPAVFARLKEHLIASFDFAAYIEQYIVSKLKPGVSLEKEITKHKDRMIAITTQERVAYACERILYPAFKFTLSPSKSRE